MHVFVTLLSRVDEVRGNLAVKIDAAVCLQDKGGVRARYLSPEQMTSVCKGLEQG